MKNIKAILKSYANIDFKTKLNNKIELVANVIFAIIIIILIFVNYLNTFAWMYYRYINPESYYSHGFIIPVISAYFIWNKRHSVNIDKGSNSKSGLLLIIFAVLIKLVGNLTYLNFINGISLFLVIIGVVIYIFGKDSYRKIRFPLLFLIFMLPLPITIISQISFPMKILITNSLYLTAKALGIPILKEGVRLTITTGELIIGNPCSGLRSLIVFLSLGSLFAYLAKRSFMIKIVVILLSIPVAFVSNYLRVMTMMIIALYFGIEKVKPETFLHTLIGVVAFMIGICIFMMVLKCLESKNEAA